VAKDQTVNRIRLYINSMARYGKSPYIYPLNGLDELPHGFARRLSVIHGDTYMLNASFDEVPYAMKRVIIDVMKHTTKTKKIVIADPSYFSKSGLPAILCAKSDIVCVLKHPIKKTDGSDSL
jgi:Rab GDP dissociation inhibitor